MIIAVNAKLLSYSIIKCPTNIIVTFISDEADPLLSLDKRD
ncbi:MULTISPECIES: hypothetical protein [Vibrio]|nr:MULTISPECIES: hypothetical protein [Vibrio]